MNRAAGPMAAAAAGGGMMFTRTARAQMVGARQRRHFSPSYSSATDDNCHTTLARYEIGICKRLHVQKRQNKVSKAKRSALKFSRVFFCPALCRPRVRAGPRITIGFTTIGSLHRRVSNSWRAFSQLATGHRAT